MKFPVTSLTSIVCCLAACGAGSALSLLLPPKRQGLLLACAGSTAAVAAALGAGMGLLSGTTWTLPLWAIPGLTMLALRLDPLSALFVLMTGLVVLPASIHAGGELRSGSMAGRERSFTIMSLALAAAIVMVLIAGDALLFLLAWEVMSILCYLLIASGRGDGQAEVGSGYLLLAMGEAGTLAAAVGFLLLAADAPSLEFAALKAAGVALGPLARWAVFLLTFFGFGVKAGLVPVNSWLQRAYADAPPAFAPVLAGVTLNLGLYGILRVNADLLPATAMASGLLALAVGTASALLGILYATTDNDLKVVLANSSIENAGIVVAASGAGMVFIAAGHPALGSIAFVAAIYHLSNHSLYKTLLFIGVGAVETQSGTRDMDRLGGLARAMPVASAAFLTGTLAIAGLPPLNGFVSEWLTLQSLLRAAELSSTGAKLVFALCGAALALTAALAVTCFVKVFAMTFLGMRRLPAGRRVGEAGRPTLAAMGILGLLCLGLGLLPTYVIGLIDPVTMQLSTASGTEALVPPFFAPASGQPALPAAFAAEFHDLGAQVGQSVLPGRGLVVLHRGAEANPVVFAMSSTYLAVALVGLLLLAWAVVRLWLTRRRRLVRAERWDGGLRRLLPEMTYTATGFSNPVRVIFDAIFRPTTVEDTRDTVAEHFRNAIRREKAQVHLVDRVVYRPIRRLTLIVARQLAAMHHGNINAYVTYAFLALLIVLLLLSI